jgi:hypothetical protein
VKGVGALFLDGSNFNLRQARSTIENRINRASYCTSK